jgi:hypothetical protein
MRRDAATGGSLPLCRASNEMNSSVFMVSS